MVEKVKISAVQLIGEGEVAKKLVIGLGFKRSYFTAHGHPSEGGAGGAGREGAEVEEAGCLVGWGGA